MTQKRPKGLKSLIFSRITIIVLLLLLQLGILAVSTVLLEEYAFYFYCLFTIISAIIVIHLSNHNSNSDLTFTWMLLVLVFPVFGSIFYIYVKNEFGTKKLRSQLSKLSHITASTLFQDSNVLDTLKKSSLSEYRFSRYMNHQNCFPIYAKKEIKYFPLGEYKFEELKTRLINAKKFIFMEYFIVEPGTMLNQILDILEYKASKGVDVRFMYDGMNTISTVPFDFDAYLESRGIKTKIFSPMKPIISTTQNSRDHRKIAVIDGEYAFTGGINLADEYINKIRRFGHWKDSAIMITGEAVNSFTMMFLKMWNVGKTRYDNFDKYLVYDKIKSTIPNGYVMPYGDSPYDNEDIGKNVYMHMINSATKYIYIMTPYLIIENDIVNALTLASKGGVDVRIIMPGIPDKYYAYALAKTYYPKLIEAGVKIYEYQPGFVHSKNFVADGERASVGTVNLDYRSLYHHFECGLYMYRCQEIYYIEQDFADTLEKCKVVSMVELKKRSILMKIVGWCLKLVAPLM